MCIRVFIAESNFLTRSGLATILSRYDDISVVGLSSGKEDLINEMEKNPPDVLLLDPEILSDGSTTLIQQMIRCIRGLKIMLFVSSARNPLIMIAFHAGALGCIMKDTAEADLVSAIRSISEGKAPISPEVSSELLAFLTKQDSFHKYSRNKNIPLTHREYSVLQLVSEGLPNKMIGERLAISERTVEAHVRNILKKLNASSRTQAAIFATQNGWWS
jgi:DNA-binding NarL/FixJ family response regulator